MEKLRPPALWWGQFIIYLIVIVLDSWIQIYTRIICSISGVFHHSFLSCQRYDQWLEAIAVNETPVLRAFAYFEWSPPTASPRFHPSSLVKCCEANPKINQQEIHQNHCTAKSLQLRPDRSKGKDDTWYGASFVWVVAFIPSSRSMVLYYIYYLPILKRIVCTCCFYLTFTVYFKIAVVTPFQRA